MKAILALLAAYLFVAWNDAHAYTLSQPYGKHGRRAFNPVVGVRTANYADARRIGTYGPL